MDIIYSTYIDIIFKLSSISWNSRNQTVNDKPFDFKIPRNDKPDNHKTSFEVPCNFTTKESLSPIYSAKCIRTFIFHQYTKTDSLFCRPANFWSNAKLLSTQNAFRLYRFHRSMPSVNAASHSRVCIYT